MVVPSVDILAIGVHPDDVELGAGGTLLKHVALGYKVGILDLTKGELGTNGTPALRLKEAERARKFLKAKFRVNLGLSDGFIENDKKSKLKIIKVIRDCQPKIILANAIHDRHPDHGNASKLIREATFLSGLVKIKTKSSSKIQSPWRPKHLYTYIQDRHIEPDFVVDVSGYLDEKLKLIHCYSSQFFDAKSKRASTPISSQAFIETLKGRAIAFGRRIGAEHGEGFNCEEYLGVSDLFRFL